MIRKAVLLLLTVAVPALCFAQRPKALKAKGAYIHSATGLEFPEQIHGYPRKTIYAFDKQEQNIGCTYQNSVATISIFLYPAGSGVEGRLRNQYLQALQDVATASGQGVQARQAYTYYEKDGYKINGYTANFSQYMESRLSVFECGQWFFKIRISARVLDSTSMANQEKIFLAAFQPEKLVKVSRLSSKADLRIAPAAFRDSLMLGAVLAGAFKKMGWANKHVDSLERAAGFPDLYLQLHVESLKEFAQFQKKKEWQAQPATIQYLAELNTLVSSGFLEEFILEQFDMIMIVPENEVLDFGGYEKWKQSHPVTINLGSKFYLVSYNEMKEK